MEPLRGIARTKKNSLQNDIIISEETMKGTQTNK